MILYDKFWRIMEKFALFILIPLILIVMLAFYYIIKKNAAKFCKGADKSTDKCMEDYGYSILR
tara:strand:- start:1214 stop:1402 length:189 start_codon:yes stop_codon:yes gene_type:complete